MRHVALAALAVHLALSGFVPRVWAFTLNLRASDQSAILGWEKDTVAIDTNFTGCPDGVSAGTMRAALDKAIALWNRVPTSKLTLSRGGEVATTAEDAIAKADTGSPIVVCDPNFAANTGTDPDFVPAATSFSFNTANNRIVFAFLLFNAVDGKSGNIANVIQSRPELLEIIMAHELGHAIGLGHSSDVNSLMYFDASDKRILSLAPDDMDGISFLYPRLEPVSSLPFGCGTVGRDVAAGGGSGGGGDAALPVLVGLFVVACLMLALVQIRSDIHA